MNEPTVSLANGGQNILITSPQRWGDAWLSKHHYAYELSLAGNTVYFLNPPDRARSPLSIHVDPIQLGKSDQSAMVHVISHALPFPVRPVRTFPWALGALMKRQANRIRRQIPGGLDVVWDFDSLFPDLRGFGAATTIFSPVDHLDCYGQHLRFAAERPKYADMIVTVAEELLGLFPTAQIPRICVGHGLGRSFVQFGEKQLEALSREPEPHGDSSGPQIGYIGNLCSNALDRNALSETIRSFPDLTFHFFGPFGAQSNLAGLHNNALENWLAILQAQHNVRLHGAYKPAELVRRIRDIDVWLLCYDNRQDKNGGINSHKILEYLATGRVAVSTPMSACRNLPAHWIVRQPEDTTSYREVFSQVIDGLEHFNAPDTQTDRIRYALARSYRHRILEIDRHLREL